MSPRLAALLSLLALLAAAATAPARAQEIPPPQKREMPAQPEAEEEEADWDLVEAIVAWVNDDIITVSQMEQAEREVTAQFMRELAGEQLETALAEARDRLLYGLIEQRLLVQQAEQLYDMSKLRESLLGQFKKQQGIESEEQMNEFLREVGLTQDELLDLLVENSTPGWIIQAEVTDQLSVSDQEVEAYFAEHRDELGEPPRVTFREIVLRADEEEEPGAAEARAARVVADARSGVAFEELVEAVSDSPSRDNGGLIGPVARADLAEWLVEPAFSLPVGGISDPIATEFGWHVIRVEERSEGREAELEAVRGEIENRIRTEKYAPAVDEFISGIWARSEIFVAEGWVERLPPDWRGRVVERP